MSDDQLFLRQEILRLSAGWGSTGVKRATLLTGLRRETFHDLSDDELHAQLEFLVAEKFLTTRPAGLDRSAIRYVITEAGSEAID